MVTSVSYTHLADESCVVELFRLDPEIFTGLIAVSLRIDDDRIDQLEDVYKRQVLTGEMRMT